MQDSVLELSAEELAKSDFKSDSLDFEGEGSEDEDFEGTASLDIGFGGRDFDINNSDYSGLKVHRIPRQNKRYQGHSYDHKRGEDPVSEAHNRRDNWKIFRQILRGIKGGMTTEATNGFRDRPYFEQIEIIRDRQSQAIDPLANGSFYKKDIRYYCRKISQKVEDTYAPSLNQSN